MDTRVDRESLLGRLLDSHEVLTSAQARVIGAIVNNFPISLDSLVVKSRTQVRTVLLVIRHLHRVGKVNVVDGLLIPTDLAARRPSPRESHAPHHLSSQSLPAWRERYLDIAPDREEPALLWGQRRLIPESALDRAAYILSFEENFMPRGDYLFIGDDDLVSPLVAAASDCAVNVFDIDQAVLDRAERAARELGAELSASQVDLSAATTADVGEAAVVICDPFPSADGSFERMFWEKAAAYLRPEGILISTLAPSHKSEQYAQGALSVLPELGFQLMDLQADFGRYEVFEFEFVPAELELLRELGLQSTISHTKSLFAARRVEEARPAESRQLNFPGWSAAAQTHYLTVQAGTEQQLLIAQQRGPRRAANGSDGAKESDADNSIGSPQPAEIFAADQSGGSMNEADRTMLQVAADTKDPDSSPDWLDLALRAIQSWERHRFDE
jgi:hypothetical protein